MRAWLPRRKARTNLDSFSSALAMVVLTTSLVSCFTSPTIDVRKITCTTDNECPTGYYCRDKGVRGGCSLVGGTTDGAISVDSSDVSVYDGISSVRPPDADQGDVAAQETIAPPPDALWMPGDIATESDSGSVPDVYAPLDTSPGRPELPDGSQGTLDSAVDSSMTIDAPGLLLPGQACSSGNDCANALCFDGVCCDKACTGCNACRQSLTGKKDGTCSAVSGGINPHKHASTIRPAVPGTDGACDGTGSCRFIASATVCGSTCVGRHFRLRHVTARERAGPVAVNLVLVRSCASPMGLVASRHALATSSAS